MACLIKVRTLLDDVKIIPKVASSTGGSQGSRLGGLPFAEQSPAGSMSVYCSILRAFSALRILSAHATAGQFPTQRA